MKDTKKSAQSKQQFNLETFIVNAWENQSWWLWLLLPLMLLYWVGHSIHKGVYRFGIKKAYKASIPVWVVGNITVGGSGKTPFLIALVDYLQQKNVQVAVISRGYGSQIDTSRLVTATSTPEQVGDEPCLIYQQTGVVVCVGRNRADSIELIQKQHPQTQIILCDDGLQHYKLHHDFAWIVYDAKRGLGNGMLLPVGFLREWGSRLKPNQTQTQNQKQPQKDTKEVVVHHGDDTQVCYFNLQPSALQPLFKIAKADTDALINNQKNLLSSKQIHAVTGIGYPKRFFDTLIGLGYELTPHAFPDHYQFTANEIELDDDLPIVITAKDAVKIQQLTLPSKLAERIWVLPVQAKLSDRCFELLDATLSDLNLN